MTAAQTAKFEIGQKVANNRGAWVRLRTYQHPSNFYFVYGYECWSPTFAADIDMHESDTHMDRTRIERRMTNWLRDR